MICSCKRLVTVSNPLSTVFTPADSPKAWVTRREAKKKAKKEKKEKEKREKIFISLQKETDLDTPAPETLQTAEKRATIERLAAVESVKKASVRKPTEEYEGPVKEEGKREVIQTTTSGVLELVPNTAQQHHGGSYSGCDGGAGDGGGGGGN